MNSAALITINYYSTSLIRRLEAVIDSDAGLQLYVVDNSGDFVTPYASTKIIRSGGNVGFAKACNLAARTCKEPLLFFINPDLEIELPALHALMAAAPVKARAIWGALIDDGSRLGTALVPSTSRYLPFRRIAFPMDRAANYQSLFVSGACFCVARSLFLELGGFDERIFMYGEDLDLCLRAAAQGVAITTCNEIRIRHLSGTGSNIRWPFWARLIRWPQFKRIGRSVHGHYLFLSRHYPLLVALTTALYLASGKRTETL